MSESNRPVVLVIDDDPIQRILVNEVLENAGFVCEQSEDGNEGLDKILALTPDLIILDVMMPGRDGFSVCTELRKDSNVRHLPVLMITGLDDIGSIERAFNVGATNFLTKPINLELLGYHVKYMIRASKMEQQMRDARRLAEDASTAKTQFLANMSHELRTPLNAIIGFSEMIKDEVVGPDGNSKCISYAADIYEGGLHLLKVINDVLDLSKVESGNLEMCEETCSLPDLVQSALRLVGPRATEADVSINVEIDEDCAVVWIDEFRFKQVLINLLANSVKFTPAQGLITLRARLSEQEGLVVSITDTGIGIPADQIEKALSPFGQVDGGLNRKYEGTGLGLPLANMITQNLGGSFCLESQPDHGTTVKMSFPKERVLPARPSEAQEICG